MQKIRLLGRRVRALARGQTNKQTDKQTNIPRTDQRLKTYDIFFQLLFLFLYWRSNCRNQIPWWPVPTYLFGTMFAHSKTRLGWLFLAWEHPPSGLQLPVGFHWSPSYYQVSGGPLLGQLSVALSQCRGPEGHLLLRRWLLLIWCLFL